MVHGLVPGPQQPEDTTQASPQPTSFDLQVHASLAVKLPSFVPVQLDIPALGSAGCVVRAAPALRLIV